MEVAHHDHAQNELVLVLAGTLVAHIARSAARAHLRDAAKEFAVHQVGFRLASGCAIAVEDLPMPDGVLKFRRELLRAGSGKGNQREQSNSEGAEAFVSSRFQEVIPFEWIKKPTYQK
jgi:hypothetical protein